jgi:hypothetical protein
MLAVVKLSSHLKLFGKKTNEELKVVYGIYVEGKDTLTKLVETMGIEKRGEMEGRNNSENKFDTKAQFISRKT